MTFEIKDLSKYQHIHLIGIGGISMSAIAETLHNWKHTVTGSDMSRKRYHRKTQFPWDPYSHWTRFGKLQKSRFNHLFSCNLSK